MPREAPAAAGRVVPRGDPSSGTISGSKRSPPEGSGGSEPGAGGAVGARAGAPDRPANDRKYSTDGVASAAGCAPANTSGDENPRLSEKMPGTVRRSLSLGGGALAIGGLWINPGKGGSASAEETPPAPTSVALGPTWGGATAPGICDNT